MTDHAREEPRSPEGAGPDLSLPEADDHGLDEPPTPEAIRFSVDEDEDDGRAPGMVIDTRYELVERLGVGGMGTVWRAHDFLLDIEVALKLVRSDRLQLVGRERLIREARAAAAIQHAAVVRVHGFGICDDAGYIAMELLDGRTLEDILDEDGPLDEAEAVRLILPVVDALASAHVNGVVHRDVKPGNIMLVAGADGTLQPKLLDFGIAHQRRQAVQGRLTVTGQVLGTPCYMSYEQAAGKKDIDHRADIWSLSCVLYELVAGIGPFDGDNYNAVLRAVLMDPPKPLPEVVLGTNVELWTIIARGLEKRRQDRWATMDAMGLALRRWLLKQGHRTDVAGRMVVTCDFPTTPEDRRPRPSPTPVPTLTMTADPAAAPHPRVVLPDAGLDDPGPTPQGITLTLRPPARQRRRFGLVLGACALLALPFTLPEIHPAARLAPGLAATIPEPGAAPGDDAIAKEETGLAPEPSARPRSRPDAGERARLARTATRRGPPPRPRQTVAPSPPAATSAPRKAPGTTLPLPAAPRFR